MTQSQSPNGRAQSHPMSELLESMEHRVQLNKGDVVEGKIAMLDGHQVLIDVGAKSEGVLDSKEHSRMSKEDLAALSVGDAVECYVVSPADADGAPIVSLAKARIGQDWEDAQALHDEEDVFEAEVTGHNRGGLIVYLGEVRGFVPASQIDRRRGIKRDLVDGSPDSPLATLVGTEMKFKVIEIDRRANRLILSELAATRERRKESKAELLDNLSVGQVKDGIVTSLADFGAFVDIGGADGLVHLSELSWRRLKHPAELLELGQEVQVKVISVDQERKRIGLSLKQLEPEPWDTIEDRYVVGEVVQAEITRLADFGAFARLDEEIEGLIHVSEMSDLEVQPQDVVSPGDSIPVRIIKIEPDRRRIGLSIKRADVAYDALVDQADDAAETSNEPSELESADDPTVMESEVDQTDQQEPSTTTSA